MERAAQGLVRGLALLAGIVAGLSLLGGIFAGVTATGSRAQGLVGVIGVPLLLAGGTWWLRPRVALRRRLRSLAVVVATTGCGVGLVSLIWPLVHAGSLPQRVADGAALAVCFSGGLIAILAACAVWDDGE